LRNAQYGKVCVCTADYCDYLENPTLEEDQEFALISSTKQGLRFEVSNGYFGAKDKYTIKDYEEPTTVSSKDINNATIISRLIDEALAAVFPLSKKASVSTSRSVTIKLDRSNRCGR